MEPHSSNDNDLLSAASSRSWGQAWGQLQQHPGLQHCCMLSQLFGAVLACLSVQCLLVSLRVDHAESCRRKQLDMHSLEVCCVGLCLVFARCACSAQASCDHQAERHLRTVCQCLLYGSSAGLNYADTVFKSSQHTVPRGGPCGLGLD